MVPEGKWQIDFYARTGWDNREEEYENYDYVRSIQHQTNDMDHYDRNDCINVPEEIRGQVNSIVFDNKFHDYLIPI